MLISHFIYTSKYIEQAIGERSFDASIERGSGYNMTVSICSDYNPTTIHHLPYFQPTIIPLIIFADDNNTTYHISILLQFPFVKGSPQNGFTDCASHARLQASLLKGGEDQKGRKDVLSELHSQKL